MVEGVAGARARMSPLTLSRIYKAVCIPALCYGAEAWTPSDKSLEELEKMHLQIGRRIQGLPKSASVPASHSTLGWLSIEAIFDLAKLVWLLKLLSLPYTSPYNRLALWCFNEHRFAARVTRAPVGPFGAAYRVASEYGLSDYVHDMMDTWTLISRGAWNRLCGQAVRDRYCVGWRMTRILYLSPDLTSLTKLWNSLSRLYGGQCVRMTLGAGGIVLL